MARFESSSKSNFVPFVVELVAFGAAGLSRGGEGAIISHAGLRGAGTNFDDQVCGHGNQLDVEN
jgi:hypothetical protein